MKSFGELTVAIESELPPSKPISNTPNIIFAENVEEEDLMLVSYYLFILLLIYAPGYGL